MISENLRTVKVQLKEVDNAVLDDLIMYLEHDKILITQNIAKKINEVNQSDAINYMSWALSRDDGLISTLKACYKKDDREEIEITAEKPTKILS